MEYIATGLVIIGVMLSVYFWKRDKRRRNQSVILTVVSFVLFGIFSPDEIDSEIQDEGVNSTEDSIAETKTKKENKLVEVEENVSKVEEILLQDGHPYYGGSLIEAKKYAENYDKELISLDRHSWSESSVIHIAQAIDDVINSMEIYLENLDVNLSEGEVLALIKEYLPKEEVLSNYEEPEFSKYLRKNDDENNVVNKHIYYSSKEDADEEHARRAIHVILYEEDNKVEVIQITSQRPNAISVRGVSSLEKEEWIPEFENGEESE